MEQYSKGSTPKLDSPGSNYYYNGSKGYEACEIDSVKSSVMGELSALEGDLSSQLTNFQKNLENMEKSFGEDFITINDRKLGFVDIEAFDSLTKKLKTDLETSESDSESFFSTCENGITAINEWLSQLENNYSNYRSALNTYNTYKNSKDNDEQLVASQAKSTMDKYKKLPGVPTDYGDWVRK